MALKKMQITIEGIKDGEKSVVHQCNWNGDLGEWMEIGGECGVAIMDYDEAVMHFKSKGMEKHK